MSLCLSLSSWSLCSCPLVFADQLVYPQISSQITFPPLHHRHHHRHHHHHHPPHHHQHSIIITTIINITIITTLITITTTNPRTKGITLTCHIRRRRGIHLPYVFLSKSAKTTQLKFNLRIEKRFGSRNSFHHFHAPDDPSLRQNSQRKLSNRLLSAHSENLSTLIFFRNYWLIEFLLIIFYYLK